MRGSVAGRGQMWSHVGSRPLGRRLVQAEQRILVVTAGIQPAARLVLAAPFVYLATELHYPPRGSVEVGHRVEDECFGTPLVEMQPDRQPTRAHSSAFPGSLVCPAEQLAVEPLGAVGVRHSDLDMR